MKKHDLVKISNSFVQRALNKFTLTQNKILYCLLSKYIKDNETINTTIKAQDLLSLLYPDGIVSNSSRNKKAIIQAIDNFTTNSYIRITELDEEGKEKNEWYPFFQHISYTTDEDSITFTWSNDIKRYLVALKERYTLFLFTFYNRLTSVHSQNLYILFKSYENYEVQYKQKPKVTIEELRTTTNCEKNSSSVYPSQFKQFVLNPAIQEINNVTDIFVTYEFNKKEKMFRFTIEKQNLGKPPQTDFITAATSATTIPCFVKPTVEEIRDYCIERKNNIDAERFYDFYESKGWKIGKDSMKDWKACVRTWERNQNHNHDHIVIDPPDYWHKTYKPSGKKLSTEELDELKRLQKKMGEVKKTKEKEAHE